MEPIIISASFFQEQLYLGVLGRTGEHEARRISFDCSEVLKTWPEATILCVCRRPCDTAAYPISLTADGTTYTMPLLSRETAAAGTIKLELRAVQDDTVLKSAIFYGRILPSLNGQKDAPGNPLSDALNRLESTTANAQTLADEIRQKLDNGESVGERGPQGEPGKDGSDATVTAQNIESALGYTPADKVVVDQLSEEKADKKDIPAPYTLPTASADVKGGVKVGKGLQMDGDVLRVHKPIYVHIETFTFSEDSAFERTQEPNGKAYALDAISMQVRKPAGVTIGSPFSVSVYFGNGNISQPLYFVPCTKTEEQWMLSTVENYKGLAKRTRTNDWYRYNSTSAVHEVPFIMYDNVLRADEVITKVKATSIIPAGLTFEIWGVRADA